MTTRGVMQGSRRSGLIGSRRSLLCVAISTAIAARAHAQGSAQPGGDRPSMRVTLLGTGAPVPLPDRFGPATLVEAGDQKLLFDAGRGATIRFFQLRVPLAWLDAVFLTHLHSDHVVGLPDVWLTRWLFVSNAAGRTTPFHVIGPTGTRNLMENLERAYAEDIRIRLADEGLPREGVTIVAGEFRQDGVVYDRGGVRVIAFEVDHGEHIKPAYGYRIEYRGRAVVISGDTRYSENVVRHGTGADLIIHEVGAARPEIADNPRVRTIMDHHTSPQDVGRVFSRARPRLGVYSHLVLLSLGNVPPLTANELIAQTRETYDGPLEVGTDLMAFDITDTGVEVLRWPR